MKLTEIERRVSHEAALAQMRKKFPDFKDFDLSDDSELNRRLKILNDEAESMADAWQDAMEKAREEAGLPESAPVPDGFFEEFASKYSGERFPDASARELLGVPDYFSSKAVPDEAYFARNAARRAVFESRRNSWGNLSMSENDFVRDYLAERTPSFEWKPYSEILKGYGVMKERLDASRTRRELAERRIFDEVFLPEFEKRKAETGRFSSITLNGPKDANDSRYVRYEFRSLLNDDKEWRSADRACWKVRKELESAYPGFEYAVVAAEISYARWREKSRAFSPSSDFDSVDEVIRHNHSISMGKHSGDRVFSYRLYKHNPNDWRGEEHSRGTEIAKDESDLASRLSARTWFEVVSDWPRKTKAGIPDLSGKLKLWVRTSISIYETATEGMFYDVCLKCWKCVPRKEMGKGFSNWLNEIYKAVAHEWRLDWKEKKPGYSCSDFCSERCAGEYHGFDVLEAKIRSAGEGIGTRVRYASNMVIYRIWNKVSGKSYVGKTNREFLDRWKEHFGNGYVNPVFADDLKEHGLHSFAFEIVEKIDPEEMKSFVSGMIEAGMSGEVSATDANAVESLKERYVLMREQHWIDKFDAVRSGYNRRNNVKKVPDEKAKGSRKRSGNDSSAESAKPSDANLSLFP